MLFHKSFAFLVLMGDKEVAFTIMQTEEPTEQKGLGRKVKNFDVKLWDKNCVNIVKEGNKHKVSTVNLSSDK